MTATQTGRLPIWIRLLPAALFLAAGVLMVLRDNDTGVVFIALSLCWAMLGLAAFKGGAQVDAEDRTQDDRRQKD